MIDSYLSKIALFVIVLFVAIACSEDENGSRSTNAFAPTNQTECTGEAQWELCEMNDLFCGVHEVVDSCDETREVNCGDPEDVCDAPETCGGGGETGVCGCTGESDEQLCAEAEVECGPLPEIVVDSCGVEREIESCGDEEEVCGEFETCGGAGEPGICGCEGESDEELCLAEGIECGPLEEVTDLCGDVRTIESCGEEAEVCGEFETCGGADEPGVCGCVPETNEELCEFNEIECGPLEDITDSCGQTRIIDTCGIESEVCDEFDTCGGGEEPGICGCTPRTCESEGVLCGTIDDGCGNSEVTCDLFCAEQVANYDQHACAVGSGAVKCWGRNTYGQLGTGDTQNRQNPADVIASSDPGEDQLLGNVHSVTTGTRHTCALFNDTSVRCWGSNAQGRLGEGSGTSQTGPSTEAISIGAVKLVAGEQHTCALIGDLSEVTDFDNLTVDDLERRGHIECWGHNEFGQIGDPELDYGATVAIPNAVDFSHVSEPMVAVDITVGDNHSCALMEDSDEEVSVWCWGRNRFGQVAPLAPNYEYDGQPFMEGEDSVISYEAFSVSSPQAQDAQTRQSTPVQLSYGEYLSENATMLPEPLWVSAGADYTCVVDANDDDIYCWGVIVTPPRDGNPCELRIAMESEAELVQTDNAERCSVLPQVNPAPAGGADPDESPMPPYTFPVIEYTTTVETIMEDDEEFEVEYNWLQEVYVDAIAAGPFRIRIGDATHILESHIDEIEILQVAAGPNHYCALLDMPEWIFLQYHSNLVCLGTNRSGQLGDGTDNSFSRFRQVRRDDDNERVMATQISLGLDFSCGLMDDNNIQCWGSNSHGQIGNSDLEEDESFRPFNVRLEVP